jgi:hypothetical protein
MIIDDAEDYLGERWPSIRPTVVERLIQQALLQVLQERRDPTFSERPTGT